MVKNTRSGNIRNKQQMLMPMEQLTTRQADRPRAGLETLNESVTRREAYKDRAAKGE